MLQQIICIQSPLFLLHDLTKSSEVPDWMFIGWISQMVALLDKDEGSAVHDILVSIATNYPQALCYPFKISSCNFKFDSSPLALSNEETVAT